jgi:hypothetical protein
MQLNRKPYMQLVGMQISTTTMESSMEIPQKAKNSWATFTHTCNPRYSGGRYQEDRGSKPANGL